MDLKVSIQGDGLPFIWSHGLISSMAYEEDLGLSVWRHLRGHRIIRFDARGHGLSSASYNSADYEWSSLSLDLIELIQNVDKRGLIIGGASMGCGVSLQVAVTQSINCRALVLVNPPAAWDARSSQAKIYYQISNLVREGGVEKLIDFIKSRTVPDIFHPIREKYLELKIKHLRKMDLKALPEIYLGASLSDLPSENLIRRLSVPTIIFGWKDDLMHPVSTALILHDLILGSELYLAKDLNDVKDWSSILNSFINSIN